MHAPQARLKKLKALNSKALEFRFWGNQDMFALDQNPEVWTTYTMVACHAPATPTFAYEPTRVSPSIISEHLRRTKGDFKIVREDQEEALEVLHSGKALLFPSWKFEIRGPLALLDLISRRGRLCVLSSVDAEVFWELLSQLIEDPRLRPKDILLTRDVLPGVFGEIYRTLSTLPLGKTIKLSDVAELRRELPRILDPSAPHPSPFDFAQGDPEALEGSPLTPPSTSSGPQVESRGHGLKPLTPNPSRLTAPRGYRFRHIAIRRGAVFPEIPSSLTGRLFKNMKEEEVPWFVTLVPEAEPAAGR